MKFKIVLNNTKERGREGERKQKHIVAVSLISSKRGVSFLYNSFLFAHDGMARAHDLQYVKIRNFILGRPSKKIMKSKPRCFNLHVITHFVATSVFQSKFLQTNCIAPTPLSYWSPEGSQVNNLLRLWQHTTTNHSFCMLSRGDP